MTYKAIIFDMDGVLFEIEDFYYKRRADFLQSKGIGLDHLDPVVFVGARADQMWPLILGDQLEQWDIPKLEAEYANYKKSHPTPYAQNVFPEVREVIPALKELGLSIALASNTDLVDVERALDEVGVLSYFDGIFSATDCIATKPHPAVYEKAWASLGVSKEETLIVEDSEKGIAAGVAAGIEVWAVQDKRWGVNQQQASRLIDNLSDLFEKLQEK